MDLKEDFLQTLKLGIETEGISATKASGSGTAMPKRRNQHLGETRRQAAKPVSA